MGFGSVMKGIAKVAGGALGGGGMAGRALTAAGNTGGTAASPSTVGATIGSQIAAGRQFSAADETPRKRLSRGRSMSGRR